MRLLIVLGTGFDFSTVGVNPNDLNLAAVTQHFHLVDIGLALNRKHSSWIALRSNVHRLLFTNAFGGRMHLRINQQH